MGHGASTQGRVTPTVVAPAAAVPVTTSRSARPARSESSLERSRAAALFKPSPANAEPMDGARFVTLDALRAHGKLPRCGSRLRYRHPLTGEGNANLCRRRCRVPLDASFYRELRDRIGLARWECGRL